MEISTRDYLEKICQKVEEDLQVSPTWAHVIHQSLYFARERSSYKAEPRLKLLQQDLSTILLALDNDPTSSNKSSHSPRLIDQISEAVQEFETYEAQQTEKSPLIFDQLLRWLSDKHAPRNTSDWTLSRWNQSLKNYHIRPEYFVTAAWGEAPPVKTIEWEKELAQLIGLDTIKQEVERLRSQLRIRLEREKRGFPIKPFSLHQVFLGNPGTGKTSVAKILAGIYRELGFLEKGHLVEASRNDLVGQYVGATEAKTSQVIQSALGGVLFIDEAYSLVGGGSEDFGLRAIDTLVQMMEEYRDELIVIVAGYNAEMKDFLQANSGLSSRFTRQLDFPDYTEEQLEAILKKMVCNENMNISKDALDQAAIYLRELKSHRQHHFGNAREARNLWEEIQMYQASRLMSAGTEPEKLSDEQLASIIRDDVPVLPMLKEE